MRGREELLFERFRREGANDALAELYDLVAPELLHVALHLAEDPLRAEELLQETLVAAIEGAEGFDASRRVRPWLLGILAHKARALRRAGLRSPDPGRIESPPTREPHEDAVERELLEALERALFQLPEAWRAVLVLRLRHGLNATDIAHALSRPPGTVRSQLARGLERLRELLPAGLAAALVLPASRGFASVRAAVLERAEALSTSRAAPSTPAGAGPIGGFLVKKLVLAAVASALAASAFVASRPRPEPLAGELAPDPPSAALEDGSRSAARTEIADAPRRALESPAPESVEAPAVVVPRTGALEVRVVEGANERPIPRALVVLTSSDGDRELERATDELGLARFEGLRAGRALVTLFAGPQRSVEVRAGETTELVVRAPSGVAVAGIVVDAQGDPVPNASIWLSLAHRPAECRAVAAADARGNFRLAAVQPDQYVGARARGFAPSYLQVVRGARVEQELRIELRELGGALRGRVVDERGAPVARAAVLIGSEEVRFDVVLADGFATPGPPPARLLTGDDGRFAVEGLPFGSQPVQARARGFAPAWSEAWIDAGTESELELMLRRGARVSGRVVDALGEPVIGARVACAARGGFSSSGAWSGRGGEYELGELASGSVALVASHPSAGRADVELTCVAGEARTWDARLVHPLGIEGVLRDESGRALADWIVVASDPSLPPGNWRHARSDRDGRFALAPLEERPHDIEVTERDWRAFPRLALHGVLPGGEPLELTIDASGRDDAWIEGTVLAPGGEPAADAQLAVWHEETQASRTFEPAPRDGRFEVRVPPGRVRVEVRSQVWGWKRFEPLELPAGERRDLGAIVLERGTRLVGRIAGMDEERLATLELFLARKDGSAWAVATRSGREYASGPLAPGLWVLHVAGDFVRSSTIEFEVAGEPEIRRDVALEPAAMRRVRIVPPLGSPDLRPWCVALDAEGRTAWTRARLDFVDGVYEARVSVPPGRYRLRCSDGGERSTEAALEVHVGDETLDPLVLELR